MPQILSHSAKDDILSMHKHKDINQVDGQIHKNTMDYY